MNQKAAQHGLHYLYAESYKQQGKYCRFPGNKNIHYTEALCIVDCMSVTGRI